ncbi:hypothetical protein CEUSTIGMA_g11437.t1 [Chlamydomonas eustigma]|uniref:ATP-dependent DNA helicase RecG n=1 Tax=Chlamydomonas eustigma TaxID=1157962 RepID=A0A250XM88_9CHLO|nr:hypothetical protein CEUSTIGMA_g11437.t1 [Chlamydomonas eustigma]|eukprot:GAX84012.1 hypothetical protein CEUSTIGMA_g11437.t1 [Chlamydomonas eustigma]
MESGFNSTAIPMRSGCFNLKANYQQLLHLWPAVQRSRNYPTSVKMNQSTMRSKACPQATCTPMDWAGLPSPPVGATPHLPRHQMGATPHLPRHQMGATPHLPHHQMGATPHLPRHQMGATPHLPHHQMGTTPHLPRHLLNMSCRAISANNIDYCRALTSTRGGLCRFLLTRREEHSSFPSWYSAFSCYGSQLMAVRATSTVNMNNGSQLMAVRATSTVNKNNDSKVIAIASKRSRKSTTSTMQNAQEEREDCDAASSPSLESKPRKKKAVSPSSAAAVVVRPDNLEGHDATIDSSEALEVHADKKKRKKVSSLASKKRLDDTHPSLVQVLIAVKGVESAGTALPLEVESNAVTKKTRGRKKANEVELRVDEGGKGVTTGEEMKPVKAAPNVPTVTDVARKAREVESVECWEPCGRELVSKEAKKWFPSGMLLKLQNAGLKSLLQVLMYYPRRHIPHSATLDPSREVQHVAVTGSVLKSSVKQYGFKGCAFTMLMKVAVSSPGGGNVLNRTSAFPNTVHNPSLLMFEGTATITATIFAAGRWGAIAMSQLLGKFPNGSSVLLQGRVAAVGPGTAVKMINNHVEGTLPSATARLSVVPPSTYPKGGEVTGSLKARVWSEFECKAAKLMPVEAFERDRDAITCIYSSRGELKAVDMAGNGAKRAGAISRALEVVRSWKSGGTQGTGHDALPLDPLSYLPEDALKIVHEVVMSPLDGSSSQLLKPLPSWLSSLEEVHTPSTPHALRLACRHLAMTEMIMIQLRLLKRRESLVARTTDRSAGVCHAPRLLEIAKSLLPFKLTKGQQTALQEVLHDMSGLEPMYRLLQGDVGSGKTIVAMLAMLVAAGSGRQALLLAPTEVLAEQHFAKLSELVSRIQETLQQRDPSAPPLDFNLDAESLKCALLTSSTKDKKTVLQDIAEGRSRLLVGTHSLLHVPGYKNLGLVVIDEQHKFGIRQKESIARLQHSELPHVLSMSATPIPRTIALVRFGDMAISALIEVPPDRKPVATKVLKDNDESRQLVFEAVQRELDDGGRAFIVYPLRQTLVYEDEEGEEEEEDRNPLLDLRSAEQEFVKLRKSKAFGKHRCALLHGKMSSEEKALVIAAFRSGKTPVLICTVVVEVGVDVPDASIMVVEHADRFGLAQLHQLRGRVGRGGRESSCFLLAPAEGGEVALERLKALEQCHDGFQIAEEDLKLRGAGQVFGSGTKQSGGLDATELCQREIAVSPEIVEGARRAAALTLQSWKHSNHDSTIAAHERALLSAATAFRNAVRKKAKPSTGIFGNPFDEEDDDEEDHELLGIAV